MSEKWPIGKGGMASCGFDEKLKAWRCEVGEKKFNTKVLEIEPEYDPSAIVAVTYDWEGEVEGQLAMTGYALGQVKCESVYGNPVDDVYNKVVCRIQPLPEKEREEYLKSRD